MGTDIHVNMEIRVDGKWENVFKDAKHFDVLNRVFLNIGRNYDLFAMLADVRNGVGFAGITTGSGFEPIFEPRGLPDDWDRPSDDCWLGDHSHTWFTLEELLEYRTRVVQTKTSIHSGVVSASEYKDFKDKGAPQSWCGDISGNAIKHVTNEQMEEMIANREDTKNHYTRIRWETPYWEEAPDFWGKYNTDNGRWDDWDCFIRKMKHFSWTFGNDGVRLVVGFDS